MRHSAAATVLRTAATASGFTEMDVMPETDEVLGEGGPVRRRLAAQRGRDARGLAPPDDAPDGIEHGGVRLVEDVGTDLRVAVHPEHELGQVVAADRHALDPHGGVGRDPVGHRRHLGHHPHRQGAGDRAASRPRRGRPRAPRPCARRGSSARCWASPRAPGPARRARAGTGRARVRSGSSRGSRSSGSPRAARTGRRPRGWRTRWSGSRCSGTRPAAARRPA